MTRSSWPSDGRPRPRFAAIVFLLSVAAAPCGSAQVTITLNPDRDNTLYQTANGSTSNGAGTAMFAGRNSQTTDSIRRALLHFDLAAAVPAGATIQSVSLRLYNSASNVGDQSVALHRLLESWGEGASAATGGQGNGAPAAPGDATWLHRYYADTPWSAAGGVFAAAPSAATVVGGVGPWTWSSTPALVADAQHFLDQPGSNFGWALVGNESAASTAKRFATREEPDAGLRPALVVTYIPEPSSAVLVGAIALLWQRRRPV